MSKLQLNVGDSFTYSKTVSESDVYLFAGITGDFHPNHVNEAYIKNRFMESASCTGRWASDSCPPPPP